MAKIQTLKINGEVVYPRTIKEAIVDLQGTPTIITNDGSDGDSVAIKLTDNGSYHRTFRIDMTGVYTGGANEQRIGSLIIECWDEGDAIAHGYYYGDDMSDILTEVAVYQDDIDPDTFYLMLTRDIILNSVTFAISPTDGGEVDAIITNASDDHTKVDDANISPVGGGGSSDAVLYTPQTLTAAQKKQARTNIDAEYSGKLIYDHTYNLYSEALIPSAYDSGTGYYTVASFPSWVTVGNGEDFYGILNVTDFSTANAVPLPDANSQSNVKLTKIDSTHFSVKTNAPAGTPNPNAFYFTNPGLYLSIPRGTGNVRYRVVIENGATIVSRYLTIVINGSDSLFNGGAMPFGTYALGYRAEKPLQADIEMEFSIDFTQNPPKLTAHTVRSEAIVKSNATTFTYLTLPKAYGDVTVNLWQSVQTDYFYIHGQTANITFIHDGTRVRVYILED